MEEKFHKVKLIRFQGRSIRILLQNEDGPCALLAIPGVCEISQIELFNLLGDELTYLQMDDIIDAMNMLSKLTTGIVFNLRFKGITDFEATREFAPFSVLGIPIYHGWLVDPEDSETYNAVGSKSYDSIMLDIATSEAGTVVSEDKKRPGKDSVDIFAATTATIGVPSKKRRPRRRKRRSCDDSTGSVSKHNKDRKGDLEENSNLQRALELSKVNFSDSPEDESLDSNDAKKDLEEEDKVPRATELSYGITAQKLIKDFVMVKDANQLTAYGLSCLRNQLKEHELCVLFRNNHFNTMLKFGGQIYLLLTNEAYIDKPDLVWEMLNRCGREYNIREWEFRGSYERLTLTEILQEHVASFNDAAQDNSASLSDLTLERALQEQELDSGASQLVKDPRALPVKQSKSRKLIKMEREAIERLISSVSDDEEDFKNYWVTIPSVDDMVKENFPLDNFPRPTMAWCRGNLTRISGERKDAGQQGYEVKNAWSNLFWDGVLKSDETVFSEFSNCMRNKLIDLMLNDIRKSKAALGYRKWKYAYWKARIHDFRDREPVGGKEDDVTESEEFKTVMGQVEIRGLIRSVEDDDKEFKKFSVTIPSVDIMVKENFPLLHFHRCSIAWCCKKLTSRSISESKKDAAKCGMEWENAWNNLYHNGVLKNKRDFSKYTEKEQENHIDQMLSDIEESKRNLSYRKWKFALKKQDSEPVGAEKEEDVTGSSDELKEPIATINDAALDNSVSEKLNLALKERHEFQDRELIGGEGGNVSRDFEEFKEPIASISDAPHDISVSNLTSFGFSPIFPQFQDKDVVRLYNKPLSLKQWLDSHITDESRWRRTVENVDGLELELWYGDRPKRESLAIMQSILSAVLDYHCITGRPLGNLGEHSKIFLSQCAHSFLGFQQIRFRITFPEPLELDDNLVVNLAKDMEDVRKIFQRILQGRALNPELDYLLSDLLHTYPFPKHMEWKTQLLQNYTGLWDGRLRRCFMILFFYTLACEVEMSEKKKIVNAVDGNALILNGRKFTNYQWRDKIPQNDSVFYNILTYTPSKQDHKTVGPPPKPQYEDCTVDSAIKYYRDCLHHNKDARCSLSLNDRELCLTNLFPGLVFASYLTMCKKRIFLG
ncbi:hypothetical protein OROHE_023536 [Orobanche hederae]